MSESLVVPGEVIVSGEEGFLRGHGSYLDHDGTVPRLLASVAGQIERVNKLITVKPLKARFIGDRGFGGGAHFTGGKQAVEGRH